MALDNRLNSRENVHLHKKLLYESEIRKKIFPRMLLSECDTCSLQVFTVLLHFAILYNNMNVMVKKPKAKKNRTVDLPLQLLLMMQLRCDFSP